MSKNSKTLIIAIAILIILGGAYYLSTVRAKKIQGESASNYTPAIRLGNLESPKLVRIEVPGLILEKKAESWELASSNESSIWETNTSTFQLDQSQIQYLTFSLASIVTNRLVEEAPADISIYGLDEPLSQTIVTDSDGNKAVYYLGDLTPSGDSYYIMEEGDPNVYSVSSYTANYLRISLNDIRQKMLFPNFDPSGLTQMRIENTEGSIVIQVKPEIVPSYLASPYSRYIVTSPYLLPRGVNSEVFGPFLEAFKDLSISDFIDDDPPSLEPYGLDRPTGISLEAGGGSISLLLGNQINGKRYAKLPDAPGVFTIIGMEDLFNAKPFSLIDKFILLMNIDAVEHISVTGAEINLNADIFEREDNPEFYLNGKKAEEKSFRGFYQAVISLRLEAEYTQAGASQSIDRSLEREITVEFQLKNPPGERLAITLIPYNRDFYALLQEGTTEFLVSRNQVRNIYQSADTVVYE